MFGLFQRKKSEDEQLVIVPIPPLVVILIQEESGKGAPLTQQEVEAIRDRAVCMTMKAADARRLEERRGYPDINAERCWEEWSARRAAVRGKD
jgi:hypothetical protein